MKKVAYLALIAAALGVAIWGWTSSGQPDRYTASEDAAKSTLRVAPDEDRADEDSSARREGNGDSFREFARRAEHAASENGSAIEPGVSEGAPTETVAPDLEALTASITKGELSSARRRDLQRIGDSLRDMEPEDALEAVGHLNEALFKSGRELSLVAEGENHDESK